MEIGNDTIAGAFRELTTPLIADACLRVGLPLRLAPPGIASVARGSRFAGRVVPARHFGSVDVFLEAIDRARRGDVLVIDNGGRRDEGCIGDLIAIEAFTAGLAGVLVWGSHRDSAELVEIGLPVFSYGRSPAGPQRLDPRSKDALLSARFGEIEVDGGFAAFADDDGALFVPSAMVETVLAAAREIHHRERLQAELAKTGRSLRQQLRFREYLAARSGDPEYTFRRHLVEIGGAVEV